MIFVGRVASGITRGLYHARLGAVSGTHPRLVVVRGEDRGTDLELDVPGEVRVGRGRSADFVLSDVSVSRHHATVIFDGRHVRARDEGSGNGTLKNGVPIEGEVALVDGDELEIGQTSIKLVYSAGRVIVDGAPLTTVRTRQPRRNSLRPVLLVAGAVVCLGTVGVLVLSVATRHAPPTPTLAPAPPPPPPPIVVTQLAAEPAPPVAPAPGQTRVHRPSSSSGAAPRRPSAPDPGPRTPNAAREAQGAYEDKDFATAARLARDAADANPADNDTLLELARDYAAVGAGLTRGDSNAESAPQVALTAYQDALAADVRSGKSVHSAMIRAKLGKVAPAAARAFFDGGRYEAARAACDMAVNYGVGGDPRVGETRKLLEDAAGDLFHRAQDLQERSSPEAERLYRRVLQIVPADSPWASKALAALRG
jgi:type III secretion system (T3SS) inner membrane Yop/YscD-like protein